MDVTAPQLSELDRNFIEAVTRQAATDAKDVAELVRSARIQVERQNDTYEPLELPPEVLLGLGLAVRLRRWEQHRIRCHLEMGLPSSGEIMDRVTSELCGPALLNFLTEIHVKTLQIFRQSFLWSGQDCDLNVDLALVAQEDDEFIDAVADFLLSQWEHA